MTINKEKFKCTNLRVGVVVGVLGRVWGMGGKGKNYVNRL